MFSDDVLSAGETLYRRFLELRDLINSILDLVNNMPIDEQNFQNEQFECFESNLNNLNKELEKSLQDFDIAWVTYE